MALLQDLTVFGATRLVLDTLANNIWANGYHHDDHDNNDSVLLAGGGYQAITTLLSGGFWANQSVQNASSTTTTPQFARIGLGTAINSSYSINAASSIMVADGGHIRIGAASASGANNKANYISAGPGYSASSGRYGVKVLACDQSDCQSGLGQDVVTPTGWTNAYNFSLISGNSSADLGYISFASHKVNSATYRYLGGFKDNAGTITFQVMGAINSSGFHHTSHDNDDSVLLAGGGHKPIADFSLSGHTHTFASITNKITSGNEFNFVDVETGYVWFNYKRASGSAATTETTQFNFGRGTSTSTYAYLLANGYKKSGSSDSYVLLGGGGHKALGNATGNVPISNGTINIDLNADLLDGYHADAFLQRLRRLNINITDHPINGMFPPAIFELKNAGYPLYDDPEFEINNNLGIYNNSGGGTVTHTRELAGDHGNGSGYQIKITTNGTASPGAGGFYKGGLNNYKSTRENSIFIMLLRAKIPEGYSLQKANNGLGTNATDTWLTSVSGTGKWEWYVRLVYCSNVSNYSGAFHYYITGSNDTSVTWYICYYNLIDITNSKYDGLRVRYSDQADTLGGTALDGLFTAFSGGTISSSANTLTQTNHSITIGGVTKTAGSSTASIINSLSVSKLTSSSTTNLTAGITINGVASADKTLTDLWARYLANSYTYSTRPTSMDISFGDGSLRVFKATSSTTTGKPTIGDAHIIHTAWDNSSGFDAQIAIGTTGGMQYRHQTSGTWQDWVTLLDTSNWTTNIDGRYVLKSGDTMTGALKRYYGATNNDPMIALSAGDFDVWLWRINNASSATTTTSGVYGFGLKYIGSGTGINNRLRLIADNQQEASGVTAVSINQAGQIGIGVDSDTNYRVKVDGEANITTSILSPKHLTANYEISEATAGNRLSFGSANQSTAKGINAGNLLISNAWADYTLVPTNGIYSKGQIKSGVADGTPPFDVSSKTQVQNLYAEYAQKIKPLYEKTYDPYTCTANNVADGHLFFGNVTPISETWQEPWYIYYTLEVNTTNANIQGKYDVMIGCAGSTISCSVFNRLYTGTNYGYPIYYHDLIYHDTSAKYANRSTYPAKIGVRVQSATSVTTVARTYTIKVWKLVNCTFEFPENIETRGNVYNSANNALSEYVNAYSVGLQETGDATDTTTINLYYTRITTGLNGIKQYSLIMQDGEGKWQSFSMENGVGVKTKNTTGFRLGSRIYYVNTSGNYANGSIVGNSILRAYISLIDLRYSLNITANSLGNGLTYGKPVYVVGTIGNDGLFYLDDTLNDAHTKWWTQDEPTSEDGRIYIRVVEGVYPDYNTSSMPSGNYRGDLISDGYAYWFKDGKFRKYNTYGTSSLDDRYVKVDAGATEQTIKNSISSIANGSIEIWRAIDNGYPMIGFSNGTTKTKLGLLGFGATANVPIFRTTGGTDYKLAHAGNITDLTSNTLGTSSTNIATIAGVNITAKVDHLRTNITANTTGIGGAYESEGSVITLPVIKVNSYGHVSGWNIRNHRVNDLTTYKTITTIRTELEPNSWYIMGQMSVPLDRLDIGNLISMARSVLFYVNINYYIRQIGSNNFLENQFAKFTSTIKLKDTTNTSYPNETIDLPNVNINNFTLNLDYLTIEGSSGIFDGLGLIREKDDRNFTISLCIHTKNYNSNITIGECEIIIPGPGVNHTDLNIKIDWLSSLLKVTDTSGMTNSIKISDIYENTSSTTNGYYAWDEICSPKNYSTFYYADATYRTNDYLLNANGGVIRLRELSESHSHDDLYVKLDVGATEQTIKNSISSMSKGSIEIWRATSGGYPMIGFATGTTRTQLGFLGFSATANVPIFRNTSGTNYNLAHAGNITDLTSSTLGTSNTNIATIAGVNITAKVDHVKNTVTTTAGTNTTGLSITIPHIVTNAAGHVTNNGTRTHTISFSDFPTMYWANVQVSNASSDSTEPTFAKARIKTDEYIGTASGSQCHVTFNTTNKCLDFIFD